MIQANLPVAAAFDPGININVFAFQLREDFIQILDLQVDHERLFAWRKVIGVVRKRATTPCIAPSLDHLLFAI
jgi:hypothetical protein